MLTNYKYLAYVTSEDLTPDEVPTTFYSNSNNVMWVYMGQRTGTGVVTSPFIMGAQIKQMPTMLIDAFHVAYPDKKRIELTDMSDAQYDFYIYPLKPVYVNDAISHYTYNSAVGVRLHYALSMWFDNYYDEDTHARGVNYNWRKYACEVYNTAVNEYRGVGDFNTGLSNVAGVDYDDVRVSGLTSYTVGVPLISRFIDTFYKYPDTAANVPTAYEHTHFARRWRWREGAISNFTVTTSGTPYGLFFLPWFFTSDETFDSVFDAESYTDISSNYIGTEIGVYGIINGEAYARTYPNQTYKAYTFYLCKSLGRDGFALDNDKGRYKINTGDNSEDDYKGGDYDNTSDSVDFPTLPYAALTGGIKLFSMNSAQYISLANSLYSPDFMTWLNSYMTGTTFKDYIINTKAMPDNILPSTYENITQISFGHGTLVTTPFTITFSHNATMITNRYTIFDCGEIDLTEYFGSFMDYAPNTKIQIVLPFCATYTLNIDDIMDGTLAVKYYIDLLTGECVANLKVTRTRYNTTLDSVLYTFRGQISVEYPLNQDAYFSMLGPALQLTGTLIGMAGGPAGMAAGKAVSSIGGLIPTKTPPIRSGSIGGNTGMLTPLTPYVIIERPISYLPDDYAGLHGHLLNVTKTLSTLSGFTIVNDINVNVVSDIMDDEREQLKAILKNGIII